MRRICTSPYDGMAGIQRKRNMCDILNREHTVQYLVRGVLMQPIPLESESKLEFRAPRRRRKQ
jgi:hypothetical protein